MDAFAIRIIAECEYVTVRLCNPSWKHGRKASKFCSNQTGLGRTMTARKNLELMVELKKSMPVTTV